MIQDFRFAFRHLLRKKVSSAVIIFSLVTCFACSILLVSLLRSEYRTDAFQIDADRTYQLTSNDPFGGDRPIAFIPNQVGDYLDSHYGEIESVCTLNALNGSVIEKDGNDFGDLVVVSASENFFKFFSFPVMAKSNNAISPDEIFVHRNQVNRIFGDSDPIGQTLLLKTADTSKLVTVAGVYNDGSERSHLKFDMLIHRDALGDNLNGGVSYVRLAETASASTTIEKINLDVNRPGLIGDGTMTYYLNPLRSSYFLSANRFSFTQTRSSAFLNVCAIVAGVIFFMGSFNFVSLLFLSMTEREKDTGIRKTLGTTIRNIARSSFAEVSLYIGCSFILAVVVASFFLRYVNVMLGSEVKPSDFWHNDVLAMSILAVFGLGILTILFVTRKQWKTRPVTLMSQGRRRASGSPLFYLQFLIATILIIYSITMVMQVDYFKNASLGFNKHIIQLDVPGNTEDVRRNTLKEQVVALADVRNVAFGSGNPISGNMIVRYSLDDNAFYTPYVFHGDEHFMETLDLTLIDGSFSPDGHVVNETFVKYFNLRDPIGQIIPGTSDRIVGVVKDFTCGSFKEHVPPVIISSNAEGNKLLIDYGGSDHNSLVVAIRHLWKEIYPDELPKIQLLQQDLMNKYREDIFYFKVITGATLVSILVSIFGLFAISWSSLQSRVKEFGIRKVLGAIPVDIASLLLKSLMRRLAVVFIIAIPAGYYLSQQWLNNYADRITFGVSIVLYAGGIVGVVVLMTVLIQIIKAAAVNPVDELRSE